LASDKVVLTEEQQRRYTHIQMAFLSKRLSQPRKVHRLFSQVHQALPLVHKEVDVVDLVLLTHIRLCWPTLHRALSSMATELIWGSSEDHMDRLNDKVEKTEVRINKWRTFLVENGVEKKDTDSVLLMLSELFPVVASVLQKPTANRESLSAGKRVGNSDYFDRYFQLGIPPDDVSDTSVASAMSAIADGRANENYVIAVVDQLKKNPDLVMPKLKSSWIEAGSPVPEHFIRFLIDQLVSAKEHEARWFGRSGNSIAEVWLAEMIVGLPLPSRSGLLAEVFKQNLTATSLCNGLRYGLEELRMSGAYGETVDAICALLQETVRVASVAPLISGDLPWLLYRLSKLGRREAVHSWLKETLDRKNCWTTLDFICWFVSESRLTGVQVAKPFIGELDLESLAEVIPLPFVLSRLHVEIEKESSEVDLSSDEFDITEASRKIRAIASLKKAGTSRFLEQPEDRTDSGAFEWNPRNFSLTQNMPPSLRFRSVIVGAGKASENLRTLSESKTTEVLSNSSLDLWLKKTTLPLLSAHERWNLVGGQPGQTVRIVSGTLGSQAIPSELYFRPVQIPSDKQSTSPTFALMIDVNIGVSKSGDLRHDQVPMLSVADCVDMVEAITRCTSEIVGRLVESMFETKMYGLLIGGQEPLDSLIDLRTFERLEGGSAFQEVSASAPWPLVDSIWEEVPERAFAKGLLFDLLHRAGYRNVAPFLAAL
jgi:hypothetical protein